jgi:hypothetical protein
LQLCSGCPGDYEDPDKSARDEEELEEVDEAQEIEDE